MQTRYMIISPEESSAKANVRESKQDGLKNSRNQQNKVNPKNHRQKHEDLNFLPRNPDFYAR